MACFFSENRKIYTVVFRYRNSFWMRLCVQLRFVNVIHVVRLKETLVEYIRQHTNAVSSLSLSSRTMRLK